MKVILKMIIALAAIWFCASVFFYSVRVLGLESTCEQTKNAEICNDAKLSSSYWTSSLGKSFILLAIAVVAYKITSKKK